MGDELVRNPAFPGIRARRWLFLWHEVALGAAAAFVIVCILRNLIGAILALAVGVCTTLGLWLWRTHDNNRSDSLLIWARWLLVRRRVYNVLEPDRNYRPFPHGERP